jgi:Flp pilus assembly protein TadD
MRSFFTILFLSFTISFLTGCGSTAAENSNQIIPAENINVNTNTAPAVSGPVPIFDNAEVALAEGNKYFEAGETEKAIDAYRQAVQLNPEFAEAYFRLGVAYSLLEKEAEADKLPGEVTEEPKPKGKKKEAEKTNAEKAFENAVKIYEKVTKNNPEDDVSFFYLGRSYSKLNEDDKAAKALRQAVKLNPENVEYQTELAESLINIAEYDEAVRALKKALELDENNLQAEELLERAQAGQKRIEFGKKQLQKELEQQMQQQENSKTRSRPRHDCAYSPRGAGASLSTLPRDDTATNGYTFPVENATMRDCAKRRATLAGTTVFVTHVNAAFSVEPNFRPARNRTNAQSGSASTLAGSTRSTAMVVPPARSSA